MKHDRNLRYRAAIRDGTRPNILRASVRTCLLLVFALVLCATVKPVRAQFPVWDSGNPGDRNPGDTGGFKHGPLVATDNELFAVSYYVPTGADPGSIVGGGIGRWTKCGGWEALPGLTFVDGYYSSPHVPALMTVHGNYLYVVGTFTLEGYTDNRNNDDLDSELRALVPANTIQIAKFNITTGEWTPLGQGFTATNVKLPTTIAVDANNRIYVGFYVSAPEPDGKTPVDMLDYSDDEGVTWQTVGGGLVANSGDPMITALTADGNNLYVGGNFDGVPAFAGAPAASSAKVVMWTGSAWRALDGVGATDQFVNEFGLGPVTAIASIGNNIYVSGSFNVPHTGLARFSNVSGASLDLSDPKPVLGWDVNSDGMLENIGMALAVHGGKLYVGGASYSTDETVTNLACLLDPEDAAAHWSWLPNGSGGIAYGPANQKQVLYLAAAPNGNAVYAYGEDTQGDFPNHIARWVLSDDPPPPTATITGTSFSDSEQGCTLHITGTPGSHWHVLSTSDPSTGPWEHAGEVTLWSGTDDTVTINNGGAFYKLTNECGGESAPVAALLVNVQFGRWGDPYIKTGLGLVGVDTGDYWNFWSAQGGDDSGVVMYGAQDYRGLPTSVNISGVDGNIATVTCQSPRSTTDNLLNGFADTQGGEDLQLAVDLPAGRYQIYVCADPTLYVDQSQATTFTLTVPQYNPEDPDNPTYLTVYPELQNGTSSWAVFDIDVNLSKSGTITLDGYSPLEPICNGFQIQWVGPYY